MELFIKQYKNLDNARDTYSSYRYLLTLLFEERA